jgi:hypothetical protein
MKPSDETRYLHPSDIGLVYLPFRPENYFYIDSILNSVTFEKKLVD